jgi:hypothetical protein
LGFGLLGTALPESASAYSINTTEKGRRIRWSSDHVVMRVEPALAKGLPNGQAMQALIMSTDAWRGFEGVPDIAIIEGDPRRLGHHGEGPTNGVYLPETWSHESDKLAITVVTYEMASGRLLDADIVVNPDVDFSLLSETPDARGASYDLAAVLTHEMGHVLGLGESEEDRMATMWPYADRGDVHQRTLSDDDEAGILDAYDGPAPLPASSCAPAATIAGHGAPPVWLASVLLIALVVLALRVAPRVSKRGVAMMGGVMFLSFGGGSALRVDAHHHVGELSHERVSAREPAAAARLSSAFYDASTARVGRATRLGTRVQDGLFTTDYEVVMANGERVLVALPGGEHEGIAQRVGEGELPKDGDELMVSSDGKRYAFHDSGVVWGGALGHGAAIELDR